MELADKVRAMTPPDDTAERQTWLDLVKEVAELERQVHYTNQTVKTLAMQLGWIVEYEDRDDGTCVHLTSPRTTLSF